MGSILSSSSRWEETRESKLFGSIYDTHCLVVTVPVEGDLYDDVVRGAGLEQGDGVKVMPVFFSQGFYFVCLLVWNLYIFVFLFTPPTPRN